MKRLTAMLIAAAMILTMIPLIAISAVAVSRSYYDQDLTDAQLVQLITSGIIPANVTDLDLWRNNITDVTPLLALTSLVFLDLDDNQITDIMPLAALTNLEMLWLSGNPITQAQVDELQAAMPETNITFDFWGNECCYENLDWDNPVIVGCTETATCTVCGYEEVWSLCSENGTVDWDEWFLNEYDGWCDAEGVCTICGQEWYGTCWERGTMVYGECGCFCTVCDYDDWWWDGDKPCGECEYCTRAVTERRIGDVDGDGRITINDALEILKYLAKLGGRIHPGNAAFNAARIVTPGVGNPTINDALEILKFLAKLDSKVPQG
jgi:hypothetical protein